MIYLIGGPPRCGKSTLAQALSTRLHIPYVPADYLMSVISPYIPKGDAKERLPRWYARVKTEKSNDLMYATYTPEEIVSFYLREAETYWPGIRNFILYALSDEQDFIVEGAQLRPDLVQALLQEYGATAFTTAFLYKLGCEPIASGLRASTGLNDWAQRNTGEATYAKIARMVHLFSTTIQAECERYCLPSYDTTHDFDRKISRLADKLAVNDPNQVDEK